MDEKKLIKAIELASARIGCQVAAAVLYAANNGKIDITDVNMQQQNSQQFNVFVTQLMRVAYGFDAKAEALSGTDPDTSVGDPQIAAQNVAMGNALNAIPGILSAANVPTSTMTQIQALINAALPVVAAVVKPSSTVASPTP